MFELKRSELLKEEVKIGNEVITTNLNLTKNAREVLKIVRELELLKIDLEKEVDLVKTLEELGEVTIRLIKVIFGDNANKILKFYSDESTVENERIVTEESTEEILIEVLPFIYSLIPKINEFMKNKQKEINQSLKGRKII